MRPTRVHAPTLMIVGGDDLPVIGLSREAFAQLACERRLAIVPSLSHLFEEPGTGPRRAPGWRLVSAAPRHAGATEDAMKSSAS